LTKFDLKKSGDSYGYGYGYSYGGDSDDGQRA
jgi:hypothetical protein